MSRLANAPITLPTGTEFSFTNGVVKVKGKLGLLTQEIKGDFKIDSKNGNVTIARSDDTIKSKSLHGLYWSLIRNMIIGVTDGYTKTLELVGIGYSAKRTNNIFLELFLGHSHTIMFEIPKEVEFETITEKGKSPKIVLKSCDKQLLGLVAAKIRDLKKPEPYKGKGIRYSDEIIIRKAGKLAKK